MIDDSFPPQGEPRPAHTGSDRQYAGDVLPYRHPTGAPPEMIKEDNIVRGDMKGYNYGGAIPGRIMSIDDVYAKHGKSIGVGEK